MAIVDNPIGACPCKFCGSERVSVIQTTFMFTAQGGHQHIYVRCPSCRTQGPKVDHLPPTDAHAEAQAMAEAVSKWNDLHASSSDLFTDRELMQIASNHGMGDIADNIHCHLDFLSYSRALIDEVKTKKSQWLPFGPQFPQEMEQFLFKTRQGNVGIGFYMAEDAEEWEGDMWMSVPK